jgi:hypothetical protein
VEVVVTSEKMIRFCLLIRLSPFQSSKNENILEIPLYIKINSLFQARMQSLLDLLCGLVVRVPGYRFRGPGSISGATGFC